MVDKIKAIHEASHEIYGAPKITKVLNKNGETIAQKTVSNYMREEAIKAHYQKRWIAITINSDFSNKLKNILDRAFNPKEPNQVWCSDITYIWTTQGYVYLCSNMDLFHVKSLLGTMLA